MATRAEARPLSPGRGHVLGLVGNVILGYLTLLRRRIPLPWSVAVAEFVLPMLVAILVGALGHQDPLAIF